MKTNLLEKTIWLSVLAFFAFSTALAQNHHEARYVEPGSKGDLPTLPAAPPEAEKGHFGSLELDHQTASGVIMNGYYTYEGWLRFPYPSVYGADYYTLQYRQSGTTDWKTWISSDNEPYHFEGNNACPSLDYIETDFRLTIKGGPMDGYVSNIVTVHCPVVSKCRVRSYPIYTENQLVGQTLRLPYFRVERHDYPKSNQTTEFDVEDGYYRYKWYRRNPNSGEMKLIEGVNDREYTPTHEDVGYQIVLEVTGDDVHVSAQSTFNFQLIQLPLECSVEYMDNTGFVLNSEYVLPDPEKNLLFAQDWSEENMKPFEGSLTTLKPGQYSVEMDKDEYDGGLLSYTDKRLKVSFVYSQPKYDDEGNPIEGEYEPWYREAQLMYDRYAVPFTVSAWFNNEKLSTTFDVIGKNRLGNIGIVATVTPEELEDGVATFEVFKGKYFVKARKTDGTMDTYYPNVQLWSESEQIEPEPRSWEEGWQPTSVSIAMQAAPAPLTGIGVIEGTVLLDKPSGTRYVSFTRGDDEAETGSCRVYLKKKDAEIIAQTGTDASGKFRFEKVPFGDFEVLLDVEGHAMKSVQEVAVTEDAPEVAELDYVITETEIVTKEEYIAANTETAVITISAAQQLAYYSDKNLDFTDYPDLKAYVATGYAKSGTIWLTRVKQVPANTGFLLMGDLGEYDIPVIEGDCSAYYKNLFKGTLEGATIQTTEDGYTNYYLSSGDYGVSFYKVGASGVKLGANRAYLSVPSDIPAIGTAGGTETIKVSAALQVPYYSANSLDFTDMESKGLKAYTATGYDYAKGTIWLSRVKQVPAETGILIMADKAGDYDVPKASVASVYENMFMGTLGGKTIQTEETIDGEDYINYYLSKGDYGISFYKVGASGVTLGENRCYLAVPVRKSSASGTRSFSSEADQITIQEADEVIGIPLYRGIGGDEDGTTGVKEVKSGEVKGEKWYTIQGQRVAKPGKGLYIHNGKKVVVK